MSQWGYTAAGVHITPQPTHTLVHVQRNLHRLEFSGPSLMAKQHLFPPLWEHKTLNSVHELLGNAFHKPYSSSKTAVLQVNYPANN